VQEKNNKSQQRLQAWSRRGIRHPWVAFLAATALLTVVVHFYLALFVPPTNEKVWKEVQITDGMSFKAIAATLQKEGIIRYRGYFEIIGRLEGISRKVRVGYYGFSTNMSLWEVLDALHKGKIIEYEVVIPEGYNLYQIGWTLSGTPLVSDPQEFIKLVKNKEYVHSLGIDADSLEGYLYPDTYFFPKGIKLEDIPRKMVQRYNAAFVDSYRERAEELGFTEHEIITLASIVEKEAKVPSERKLIAAVYLNRLKRGMKLQADPTAVYGTKAWVTKVTAQDLKRKSPYNTYLHKGLPPGPISNPGVGSILATLYPDNDDYLFFVAQGDGSHFFSKDFASHAKAIERYRVNKRKERLAANSKHRKKHKAPARSER
jgi:UPF0755 protein